VLQPGRGRGKNPKLKLVLLPEGVSPSQREWKSPPCEPHRHCVRKCSRRGQGELGGTHLDASLSAWAGFERLLDMMIRAAGGRATSETEKPFLLLLLLPSRVDGREGGSPQLQAEHIIEKRSAKHLLKEKESPISEKVDILPLTFVENERNFGKKKRSLPAKKAIFDEGREKVRSLRSAEERLKSNAILICL